MIGRDGLAAADDQRATENEACEESCGRHDRASRGSRKDAYDYHDTGGLNGWSRVAVLLAVLLAGCSEGVKFVQETATGGIVVYPYKGDNSLVSTFRGDALDMMQKKCPKGYTVLKEGPTTGLRRIHDNVGGSEVVTLNRWAIKFACK
jgi:hypothetical protein